MSPERLQRIEELYHAAREGTPEERAALLARIDPNLRREVESLLSQPSSGNFLDRPAVGNAPELLEDSTVTGLTAGLLLGPYRIETKLGEGGMGEVFRAIDTRLGRAVAIKTTRDQFTARFEREARAISSLNHPNICTLYDVGPSYLVMELVEGETLASRLKRGPLPVETAIHYGVQIAAAMAEAHGKDIVHRDLKPGNIMIGKTGVKVLDFGLAKSGQDETVTVSHMIVGTPAYMAPEQRAGGPVDARSDVYAFGYVFYEMLTGERAGFPRKRVRARKLETIVSRCLEEDPGRRWQTAAELQRELSAVTGVDRGQDARIQLSPGAPKLTWKHKLVLSEFENKTGDPAFDGMLRQMIALELGKSPYLSVLSDARIRETLRLMLRPPDEKITPQIAFEICERTGSAAVVDGRIVRLGRQYVLGLRARDCRTGDILDEEQAPAAKKARVLKALGYLANRFRNRIGALLPGVEKQAAMMEAEVTTPSLEAWKSYNAGMKAVMRRGQPAEAISLLKRAIEADPGFAMAYAALGRTYDSLGQSELGAQSISRAYELRDRVSDPENFFVTFNYYRQVPRNLELARQTLDSWIHKYPSDLMPHGFLSGFASPGTGRHERAAEEGQKAIDLDPDFSIGYYNAAIAYIYLNRLPEAEVLLRKASERKIEAVSLSLCRYLIAFLRNDKAAMEREMTQRRVKLEAQGWFEHQEAMTFAYQGRLREADRLSYHAVTLARQEGLPERAAVLEGARAVWNALFGLRAEAQRSAAAALSLFRGRDADYGPAFALALLQESAQAHEIAAELEQRYPEDTSVQFSYLPALRGLAALNQSDPAKALEMTQAGALYELAVPGTAYLSGGSFFGALYPVYVRGLAYSRIGFHREAAAEFQKILAQPGLVLNDAIGPMARLQLARAVAASGDHARSAAVYKDLLTLWKGADPGVPVIHEAMEECDKLR
jgi:tetratricopeptide (TPR) repeat protein